MAAPRLQLRQVPAEILCTLGWAYGTLHVAPQQAFAEFLTHAGASLNVTRLRISREPEPLGYVALRRDTISIIAPSLREALPVQRSSTTVPRDIACLLEDSILRGRVEVPTGLRLSDYLRQCGSFLTVRHGLLAPYGATLRSPDAKSLETAYVNLDHVAGISEAA